METTIMGYINPAEAIPTKQSSDGDWMAWYESLPGSQKDKNLIFSMAWSKRGDSKANTSDLRSFLKQKGFVLGSDNVLGAMKDTYLGAVGSISSILKLGATGTVVISAAFIVFAGAIIWRLATPVAVGTAIGAAADTYTGGAGKEAGTAAGTLKH